MSSEAGEWTTQNIDLDQLEVLFLLVYCRRIQVIMYLYSKSTSMQSSFLSTVFIAQHKEIRCHNSSVS